MNIMGKNIWIKMYDGGMEAPSTPKLADTLFVNNARGNSFICGYDKMSNFLTTVQFFVNSAD